MKNPCKKCLVRMICIAPCEDLNKFSRSLGAISYIEWTKNYECRPAVLELIEDLELDLELFNGEK